MARYVKSIEVKNYKAFKEGTLFLDPLSLLIGTNSSGKSSLLKLILMLAQSTSLNNKSFIDSYGELTDLGDISNMFFNQDISKTLSLKFNLNNVDFTDIRKKIGSAIISEALSISRQLLRAVFDVDDSFEKEQRQVLNSLFASLQEDFYHNEYINNKIFSLIKKSIKSLEKKLDEYRTDPSNLDLFPDDIIIDSKHYYSQERDLGVDVSYSERIANLYASSKFLNELSLIKSISSIEYKLNIVKEELRVSEVVINTNVCHVTLSFWNKKTKRSCLSITSNIIDMSILKRYKRTLKQCLTLSDFTVKWTGNVGNKSQLRMKKHLTSHGPAIILYHLISTAAQAVRNDFHKSRVHHVGPLRFNPERYFLMDQKTGLGDAISNSGKRILSVLSEKPEVKEEINLWLKKFDLEVTTDDITHIIHSIKVTDNGLSLDITDVGFGISQILPVILISVIAKPDELTIIEQPEIHIHPKMQSELADFFISQICDKGKCFLIETHSEALLKRLRRRMAEYFSDQNKGIPYKNVAIHFVEKRQNKRSGASLSIAEISESGHFDWPTDFRENDVIDTIEFMKHQG